MNGRLTAGKFVFGVAPRREGSSGFESQSPEHFGPTGRFPAVSRAVGGKA